METKNYYSLANRLLSVNRAYSAKSLIAVLYKYYVERYDEKAKYSDIALDYVKTHYQFDNVYEQVAKLLDEQNLTAIDFREFTSYFVNRNASENRFARFDSPKTPQQIIDIVCGLLDFHDGDSFIDAGSGTGETIEKVYSYCNNNGIKVKETGVEINTDEVMLSSMYLDMVGVEAEIIHRDILKEEKLPEYNKAYVFPPFGGIYSSTSNDLLSKKYGSMFNFKSNSEWMFVFRMLANLKNNGKVVALLPSGVLFRNTGKEIRKYLVENDLIEGVIILPQRSLYPSMGVATILLVLGSGSKNFKMVDASSMCEESLSASVMHVDEILEAYEKNAIRVDYNMIVNYDYNLNPSIYFGDENTPIPYETEISNICSITTGSQYTISKFKDVISEKPTDYQILTSSDIQNGLVDYSLLTYIAPDKKLLKFALEENDIVVTTKSTKVKTFVAKDLPERNIIVTGGMIILHPDTSKVNPTFLKMFLDSSTGAQLMQRIMQGVTIKTISVKDFARMSVSCPPLEKQEAYSKKYNSVLAMYGAVQEQLVEIQKQLENFYETEVKEDE